MTDEVAAHAALRLAVAVLVATVLAGVWEVLATQAPGSPLYLGMLPGPVQALRESALMLGVLLLVSSDAWSRVHGMPPTRVQTLILVGLHLGALLSLGAATYGATQGMRGEQLYDLRPDGMLVFATKYAGNAVLALSLGALALRVLAARRRAHT